MFSLEKRRLRETSQDLKETYKLYKLEGEQMFTRVDNDRIMGNGFKLRQGRFSLDIRGKFCIQTVVRHFKR